MYSKVIPSTHESIPVIGLGSWSTFDFQNQTDRKEEMKSIFSEFANNGGRLIDTSPMYGNAEERIGEVTEDLKLRDSLFLATKVWTTGKEDGIRQMNKSMKKMKVDKLDLIQVHNLVDVNIHLRTLRDWKSEGKIRYAGITHYTTSAYSKLIELIRTEKPDFVQFNYNVKVREAERELLPAAKEHGVAVIINRPFEEGALFTWVKEKPLPPWALEHNITTWAQYFLAYIISHEAVTCVIPATADLNHLRDLIKAGKTNLPDENVRRKMISYLQNI